MQRDALCQEAQAHQDRQGLPVEEDACPERFRRAIEQGDGQAQEAIEQRWRGLLLRTKRGRWYSYWRWWIIQSAPDERMSGSFSLHSTVL